MGRLGTLGDKILAANQPKTPRQMRQSVWASICLAPLALAFAVAMVVGWSDNRRRFGVVGAPLFLIWLLTLAIWLLANARYWSLPESDRRRLRLRRFLPWKTVALPVIWFAAMGSGFFF